MSARDVPFVKMSGAGNDMILVDHRTRMLAGRENDFARQACDRRFGIGADGVILIAPSMGGGVALTFLERSELAPAVRGLVLDSPLVDFGRAVDARAADEMRTGA